MKKSLILLLFSCKLAAQTVTFSAIAAASLTSVSVADSAAFRAFTPSNATTVELADVNRAGTFSRCSTCDPDQYMVFTDATGQKWQRVNYEFLNPKWFGAKGDGVADDLGALQRAEAFAGLSKKDIYFPTGTYLVSGEWTIDVPAIRIWGEKMAPYNSQTTIRAKTSGQRSVIRILNVGHGVMENITLDAARLVNYALLAHTAVYFRWENVEFIRARLDGVHFPSTKDDASPTLNDNNRFVNCYWRENGTVRLSSAWNATEPHPRKINLGAATATVTVGSQTVNFSGVGVDTMGLRKGDLFRVGSKWYEIFSVNSATQLTLAVRKLPDTAFTNSPFSLHSGAGYFETSHADNNLTEINGGGVRSNAAQGFRFGGLYGPSVTGVVNFDGPNVYGFTVGSLDGSSGVFSGTFSRPYFEGSRAAHMGIWFGRGISIFHPNQDMAVPLYEIGASFQNFGFIETENRTEVIGSYYDRIPAASESRVHVTSTLDVSASTNLANNYVCTAGVPITLTVPFAGTAGPNESQIFEVVNIGTAAVTVDVTGAVNGFSNSSGVLSQTYTVPSASVARFFQFGANWQVK